MFTYVYRNFAICVLPVLVMFEEQTLVSFTSLSRLEHVKQRYKTADQPT